MNKSWLARLNNANGKSRYRSALIAIGLFWVGAVGLLGTNVAPAQAAAGINSTVNFQGRLLNAAGAVVADGQYNVQFKIYQNGPGNVAGDTGGTLMWTESWVYGVNTPDNRVTVKNGYFSVPLGTICPMTATTCTASTGNAQTNTVVDFNQDTLWLSVNIGNTSTAATFAGASGDGEMLPMRRLASSVYALNAGKLGGLTSGLFVQLAQGLQVDASTSNASIAINKTGTTANILDIQRGGAGVMLINNAGQTLFRPTTDSPTALQVQKAGTTTTVFTVDTSNTRVGVGNAAPGYTLDVTGDINASANLRTGGTIRIDSSGALQNATADAALLTTGTLGVARGGTGVGTFTSNGILYGNGTGVLQVTAAGTTGQCLVGTTSAAPSWGTCSNFVSTDPAIVKYKTADETVNNTATYQSDDHLFFNIGANETWAVDYEIMAISGTTPDFKFIVTPPAGATFCREDMFLAGGSFAPADCLTVGASAAGTGTGQVHKISAVVTAGATGGQVDLQWAQNTATASNTTVYQGSFLKAHRVSGTGTTFEAFIQGGNSFGATAVLGTNDAQALSIQTNGLERIGITSAGNLNLGNTGLASTINLGNNGAAGAVAQTINIGTNSTAGGTNTVAIGNSAATASTVNIQGGTGATAVALSAGSGGTIKVGSTNVANTITIGNTGAAGAVAQGINIGTNSTAGGTNTIVIGNSAATASTVTIQGGTGAGAVDLSSGAGGNVRLNVTTGSVLIGNSVAATVVSITGGTGANAVNIGSGAGSRITIGENGTNNSLQLGNTTGAVAQAINIGTNSTAGGTNTVTIGNSTATASTINIQGGTGSSAVLISAGSGGTLEFGSSNVANTLNIGNNGAAGAVAQTLNIGTNSTAGGTNTIAIGNSTATASTVNIQGGTGASAIAISAGSGGTISIANTGVANTVTIGNTTGGVAQTLNIGTNATASSTNTINIGNGATNAVNTVSIGSLIGASTTTIQAGTGDVNILTNNAAAGVLVQSQTNSTAAFQVQNAAGDSLLLVDTTTSNLLTNPGFETNATGWAATGTGASATRTTTAANVHAGIGSYAVTLGSVSGTGARISATGISGGTQPAGTYTFSFYARNAGVAVAGLAVSFNGGGTCTLNLTTLATAGFERHYCTVTTTSATTQITISSTTTAQVFYLDSVMLEVGSTLNSFRVGGIQISGVVESPLVLQNTTDSTQALIVRNSSGDDMFTINTANGVAIFENLGTTTGGRIEMSSPGANVGMILMSEGDFRADIQRSDTLLFIGASTSSSGPGGTQGLYIYNGGVVCIKIAGCTATGLGVSGTIRASGAITASTTPDIAETIPAAPDVEAADVVMADPNNTERVVKASGAYTGAAVGVISDGSSSFMINSYANAEGAAPTGKPLVLAGRVPVKVTNEGGPIRPGDYLTTSSTPGYAMKATHAGPTIGKSLGFFDGAAGTVLALVNVSYYDPYDGNNLQATSGSFDTLTASSASFGSLNVSGATTLKELTVEGSAVFQNSLTVLGSASVQDITVNGHVVSAGVTPVAHIGSAAGAGSAQTAGPAISIEGNDIAGTITITASGANLSAGTLAEVLFAKAYGRPPRVQLTPVGSVSATLQTFVEQTGTGFIIGTNSIPASETTYVYNYQVIE